MLRKTIWLAIALGLTVNAQDLKIAAGAGYKKPLMDIIKEYEKSGKKIEPFFGNMKQVSTQAKHTDIALIVGDKNFLSKKSGLNFKGYTDLGKGKVVIAYPKGKTLTAVEDIKKPNVRKISMPQPKKAIYGIAGEEFLKSSKMYNEVKEKLYVVATVPQSMTYIITNEVDAGVVNLTAALANRKRIGGYIEVPQKYYNPIDIVAGKLKACNSEECKKFTEFLETKTAKDIFKKYGL